jgi:hypothetical protein
VEVEVEVEVEVYIKKMLMPPPQLLQLLTMTLMHLAMIA